MESWTGFFQSSASAAATLIGLVVVAISINLTRILAYPNLPPRAAAALAPLAGVLLVSLLALPPNQSIRLFGAEVLAAGIVMGLSGVWVWSGAPSERGVVPPLRWWSHLVLHLGQSLPFVAAGVLLIMGQPAGLGWIVPGVILSLVAGLTNTWVLLVEILR